MPRRITSNGLAGIAAIRGMGVSSSILAGTCALLMTLLPAAGGPPFGWEGATPIEFNNRGAGLPDVAVDRSGNAVVVWKEAGSGIWANVFSTGERWGVATLVYANQVCPGGCPEAEAPYVDVDAAGNALAVWAQGHEVWSSRFVRGAGWGPPTLVETLAGVLANPQVGVDASGRGIAVWTQWDGTAWSIWANRFVPEEGWATPRPIEDSPYRAGNVRISVGTNGHAVVVWGQSGGSPSSCCIWANSFDPGTGWGAATRIEDQPGLPGAPRIAVDAAGNGLAVWGYHGKEVARRFVPGVGWGTPTLFTTAGGTGLDVAINDAGRAVVVWVQLEGGGWSGIWATRFDPDIGWGKATRMRHLTSFVGGLQVDVDSTGDAMAVWYESSYTIWASRLDWRSGWGKATRVDDEVGNKLFPQIGVDQAGSAVVVWSQWDGIWVNRYVARTH